MDAHEFQLENTGGTNGLYNDDDGVQVFLFLAQVLQGELEPFIGSALGAQQEFQLFAFVFDAETGKGGTEFICKVRMDGAVLDPTLREAGLMGGIPHHKGTFGVEKDRVSGLIVLKNISLFRFPLGIGRLPTP